MRILLDECLPARLKRELVGHDAQTVADQGWTGQRNGDLLRLAEREFDVFLTVDRNLSFQQDVARFEIAIVVMTARTNQLRDLQPLVREVLAVCSYLLPGQLVKIG